MLRVFLFLFLVALPMVVQAQDIPLIDPANPMEGWQANNGQEFPGATVDLQVDEDVTRDGKPSLRLTADLTKGGRYCDMSRDVSKLNLDIESVSFWLKAPGMDRVTMRLVDSAGRCHQLRLSLEPAMDDWRLVSFPVARFFEKRGTAEAVQGVMKYEAWGGPKKGADGFNGTLQRFILLTGTAGQRQSMWVSDPVATVRSGTVGWSEGFEAGAALPHGWTTHGTVQAQADAAAFKGERSLTLQRTQERRDEATDAVTPTFPVAPGLWQMSVATAVDLESPDASYSGSVHVELIDAGGKVIDRVELATPYGQSPWKVATQKVRTSHQVTHGRFVLKMNKSIGTFRVDELQAQPLDTRKLVPAVDRIVLDTPSLGNLLLPDAPRSYSIRVESTRKLKPEETTVTWSVRDYWGALIAAAATVQVTENGTNANRVVYEAVVDLTAYPLEVGRYYEFHAEVPLTDNDPFRNSSGFAILPRAESKNYRPIEIPFTARNWDNRVKEYILLSDRLGFRIIGLWGGAHPTERGKAWAPQIELCAELDAGILTGSPARINDIEYHREGWQRWTVEENIRGAIKDWFDAYGDHQPKPIIVNLGNEPHGTGEQVLQQVRAYKIAYDEIKKQSPDTIVVATSVNANREYFEAGYQDACDAFDFHVYESPEAVRRTIAKTQALMEEFDCVKPIYATELGLNSQGLTREHVSADMVKKFTAFFGAGGASMNWFDLLYPDPEGKALGTSGDSFNMFDSRYRAYAARLDAVMCYNLINGILNRPFTQEISYADGTHAALWLGMDGEGFIALWRDAGRADIMLPLPGVSELQLTQIDGRLTTMNASGGGVTLTVGVSPVLLRVSGLAALPATLGEPAATIQSAPQRLQRGAPGRITLAGTIAPEQVRLIAPATWTTTQDGLVFTVTSPETSPAREGDLQVQLTNAAGDIVGLLNRRPVMTGQLALELQPIPAPAGGKPAVKVVVANQSAQAQTVTWALSVATERTLVDGAWTAPSRSSAYLTESGNGSLTVAPKSEASVTIPIDGVAAHKLYQLEATITDSTGGITPATADLRP